jgi:predicted transcriptional regulator
VVKVFRQSLDHGDATLERLAEVTNVPAGVFEPVARQLQTRGYVTESDTHYRFTPEGTEVFADLVAAWRRWLLVKLTDWNCDDPEFTQAVDRVATELTTSGRALTTDRHPAAV